MLFENNADRRSFTRYFLPTVELKDYNAMINGKNFFDQPIKNDKRTYDKIQKIATGQRDKRYNNRIKRKCTIMRRYILRIKIKEVMH